MRVAACSWMHAPLRSSRRTDRRRDARSRAQDRRHGRRTEAENARTAAGEERRARGKPGQRPSKQDGARGSYKQGCPRKTRARDAKNAAVQERWPSGRQENGPGGDQRPRERSGAVFLLPPRRSQASLARSHVPCNISPSSCVSDIRVISLCHQLRERTKP
jgi:hypothetical protein